MYKFVAITILVVFVSFMAWIVIKENEAYRACLDAGYLDIKEPGLLPSGWYCVGVREGNAVVVPVEEVLNGQGQEH